MIELSIIIPVYKTEKYIRECVDSVLREAPQNSEIILVDDGSPDNCPKICDEYAELDKRIRVIHQENKGLSAARNAGIDVAKGKKLFFIDSDDYLSEGYFLELLGNNADLTIGNYLAFYEDKTTSIKGYVQCAEYSDLKAYLVDFHYYFATLFNFAWGKIYDNEILQRYDLRFTEGVSMVEDVLFNIEYYRHCKSVTICADALLNYRQTQGTLSKKISLQLFDWYTNSYESIRKLLIEKEAFTEANSNHFHSHFIGNVLECIIGYWKYPCDTREEKYIKIMKSELLQEALPYYHSKRTKKIIKALKQQSIKKLEKSVKEYLFWANVRKKIRSLL